ncbi:hypothetical protein, conserved [Thermococcus kodakarensis KOD1]|uniref:Uncharacterized protein n=1 Tax=Thermococcus kodakarensis (strain ATCC BAA-918 / JCM 12380 / KOD1) TaxID=69014 RepID=Q5JDG8_THEKO|nr:hypothetical protein, conserved [Thermococcus kodakarensis KOD1]
MMLILEAYFKNYPARRKVAEFLFENGLSVKNGKIYIKNVEVPISELARAIGVNRKIIYHTIEYIEKTYPFKLVFERLNPLPSLIDVAPLMGWEVLEIDVEKDQYQMAFSDVLRLLAEDNTPIMEVFGRNLRGRNKQDLHSHRWNALNRDIWQNKDNQRLQEAHTPHT